jgi:prepilin-type N-terminal cleavage/methylation domain-containing protein
MNQALPIADCRLPIETGQAARCRSINGGASVPASRSGQSLLTSSPTTNLVGDEVTRLKFSLGFHPGIFGKRGTELSLLTSSPTTINHQLSTLNSCRRAFTLVEVMVVMALLSLIVIALMGVFSSTQAAFRASVTQTDVLESGRAAMDLMTGDLREMARSSGYTNLNTVPLGVVNLGAVNFFATNNSYAYTPLAQNLPASNAQRTNLLNYFFVLGRNNTSWTGTGYIVDTTASSPIYPLYRFYTNAPLTTPPRLLFNNFISAINRAQWTSMSHMMDGVVHLVVRAYDVNGFQMTNTIQFDGGQRVANQNTFFVFTPQQNGVPAFYFMSNSLPASVEIEMATLEDRTLQRAESLGVAGQAPSPLPANNVQWSYLQNQAATRVHVFRQRVAIPNVDPAVYQ